LDEERREWDERDDNDPWPRQIASWQDSIWLHLSDAERDELNGKGSA